MNNAPHHLIYEINELKFREDNHARVIEILKNDMYAIREYLRVISLYIQEIKRINENNNNN